MTELNESNVPEVDPQVVIQVLIEENRNINENRLYLLALLRQKENEHNKARALWEIERESLKGKD